MANSDTLDADLRRKQHEEGRKARAEYHAVRRSSGATADCITRLEQTYRRAQVLGGRLYMTILRAQHATIDVNHGPKLLLLDTLREHPSLPDVDIRIAAATRTLGCPRHSTDEHSGPCGDSRVAVRQPDGGGPAQLQVGPKKLLAGDRRRVAPRSPAALLAVHRA